MERRNIQRTGGSSFTVTLPKQWIEQQGLKDKDTVELTPQPSGALLIRPESQTRALSKVTVIVDGLSNVELGREVISAYLAGADDISIDGEQLDQQQRSHIRSVVQSLMGLEIVEESSSQIVIRNIFDNSKLSIPQNIEKMFVITRSMFSDSMKALATKDMDLAQDVIDRDLEVDKLHCVIIRQFHSLMTCKITEEVVGLSLVQCNYYSFVATQIERIADHAVKISKAVMNPNGLKPKRSSFSAFADNTEAILLLLERSSTMVQQLDKKMAHDILDEFEIKDREQTKLISLMPGEPIIADSLDRVQRYVMNIAEMTINQLAMVES